MQINMEGLASSGWEFFEEEWLWMSPNLLYPETSVIFTLPIDQLLKDKDTDLQDQHSVSAIYKKNG